MKRFDFFFDIEENTNVSTDFAPAISVDHVTRLVHNIDALRRALGIAAMKPVAAGAVIKRYKKVVTTPASQVSEGEVVPLSKVVRSALPDLVMSIKKYRRLTTAEAIQSSGADIAINDADEALIGEIRKDVKSSFFDMLAGGTDTITGGNTLQSTLASLWARIQTNFEDIDARPIYFINPVDVASYLGTASITTQTAFGFDYVENFLGLGAAFISPQVEQGKVYGTASENLNGVYVASGGDVANAFGLIYDESGMVGMTHTIAADRASIQTLILSGVLFYPEAVDKISVATITQA